MSGVVCCRCGRGALDGYGLEWWNGRLEHDLDIPADNYANLLHDEWLAMQCVTAVGLTDGMVTCDLRGHAVWVSQAVLAEQVHRLSFPSDRRTIVGPRATAPGLERWTIRFQEAAGLGGGSSAITGSEASRVAIPEGTKTIIFEAKEDGTPYLACRACA